LGGDQEVYVQLGDCWHGLLPGVCSDRHEYLQNYK